MKFLQKLALLIYLLMIAYISKRKKAKILVYVDNMAVAAPGNIHITSFKMALHNDFDITVLQP